MMKQYSIFEQLGDFLRFSLVSGVGWLIDIGLFTVLVALMFPPTIANLISAGVAVTYVYIVSTRHIFVHGHCFQWQKYILYLAYQVLAISLASLAIGGLHSWIGGHPLISKLLVTPLTLYVNFVFMAYLLQNRLRFL